MSIDVPLGYGYVNALSEETGNDRPEWARDAPAVLSIAGWLLGLDGPFDSYSISDATGTTGRIDIDVAQGLAEALPQISGAERGGFIGRIPLPDLVATDTAEIEVLGHRDGKPVARLDLGYHRSPKLQPFPPSAAMVRASGNDQQRFWRATGIKTCNDFRRILAPHLNLDGVGRLLDWGCGSGRVTVHLIDQFPAAEVAGADIDTEAVDWAAESLEGRFTVCGQDPPLSFPDSHFDLVTAASVMTHLTRDHQERWLLEILRVLRPGGIFLATTHGEFAARWLFPDAAELERILEHGFHDDTRDAGLQHVASSEYYRSTYQTIEFNRRFWGRYFEVLEVVEGGMNNLQDVWVLRNNATPIL